jgi:hypothetical protein
LNRTITRSIVSVVGCEQCLLLIYKIESLPGNFVTVLWAKKNLEIGDTIQFKAKIKKTKNQSCEIERLSCKSLDMIDPEEVIKIVNVSQLVKI